MPKNKSLISRIKSVFLRAEIVPFSRKNQKEKGKGNKSLLGFLKSKKLDLIPRKIKEVRVTESVDGSFQTEVYLPREGIHILTVEVVDKRGKKSVVQLPVRVQF